MHAALVTAYKDFPMLAMLVDALHARGMRVFCHVDRRSSFPPGDIARLEATGCVVSRRYKVFWGSYSHLSAMVSLMRQALADPAVSYVHTLSGQDFPIKDAAAIDQACDGGIFMSAEPLEDTAEAVQDRFTYFKLLYPMERWRTIPRPIDKVLRQAQRRLGVRRVGTRSHARIFKGLVWMSLPAEAARHAVEDERARRLLHELRLSYLPEEFFFQTAILNSPFAARLRASDLRYIDWGPRDGLRPAVLDLRDAEPLAASPALFARKLDSRISAGLLARLGADPQRYAYRAP